MTLGLLARVALLAALWTVGGTTVFAQLQSGRILGTVYDPQRAGIPGATVTVTNLATNIARTVVTDSEGNYVVTPIDPGTYSVSAEVPGFQKTVRDGLVLTVGQSARVELALDLGTLSAEVQVRAESPLLNTESATLSQVITNEQIVDLPLNGRGFHELARLTSGVALLPPTGNVQTVRPEQVNGNVIGGVGGAQTRFLLDGVDITEEHQGGTWIQTSVDALQEFSVQQNAYSAEFHGAGATFNVTTKSGGNVFHGSLFEFVRNDAFDAKNFFATSKEKLERNRSGGNGVPIGACWARAEVAAAFLPGDHATTFGGQPLATSAARKVLEVMEREDVPGPGPDAGERLGDGLLGLPDVTGVRGLGLLLGRRAGRAATAGRWPRPPSTPGWSSTASAPPPLRFAPQPAGDRGRDRRSPRDPRKGVAGLMRHLLEIDDLTQDELFEVLDLARDPNPPQVLARKGMALRVREAVGPHPQLHGDGGRGPRRPPGHHPGRGGRHRPAGVGRGRGPHAGLLPRRHRGPGLRPLGARAHGRGGLGADHQPALRRRPPAAGAGRPADDGRRVRRPRRPHAGLRRRRQQRVPGRWPSAATLAGMHVRVASPPGYAPRPRSTWTASPRSAVAPPLYDRPEEAVTGADAVYTDVWTSMGQEAEAAGPAQGLRGLHGRRAAHGARPASRRSSCTACPPTGARRSPPRCWRARRAGCGGRPRTACTRPGAPWPGSWARCEGRRR